MGSERIKSKETPTQAKKSLLIVSGPPLKTSPEDELLGEVAFAHQPHERPLKATA